MPANDDDSETDMSEPSPITAPRTWVVAVWAALAACAILTPAARAGTFAVDGTTGVYRANPAQANAVNVSWFTRLQYCDGQPCGNRDEFVVQDDKGVTGCFVRIPDTYGSCGLAGLTAIDVALGDGDDVAVAFGGSTDLGTGFQPRPWPIPVTVRGEEGNDVLSDPASGSIGSAGLVYDGGPGNDRLAAPPDAPTTLLGGDGDDELSYSDNATPAGVTRYEGGPGNDLLVDSGNPNNVLIAGEGDDRIALRTMTANGPRRQGGPARLSCGPGRDIVSGPIDFGRSEAVPAGLVVPADCEVVVTRALFGAPPIQGSSVALGRVTGIVLVQPRGRGPFRPVRTGETVPVESVFDTVRGRVALIAAVGAEMQTADFFDGTFRVTQPASLGGTVDLRLLGRPTCPKRARGAAAPRRKPRLWGDGKGNFRVRGAHSAATIRGTRWLVEERCTGTFTRVARGSVSVRDTVRRKTVILAAPRSYLARPRR